MGYRTPQPEFLGCSDIHGGCVTGSQLNENENRNRWAKEVFKTGVENAMKNVNNQSRLQKDQSMMTEKSYGDDDAPIDKAHEDETGVNWWLEPATNVDDPVD